MTAANVSSWSVASRSFWSCNNSNHCFPTFLTISDDPFTPSLVEEVQPLQLRIFFLSRDFPPLSFPHSPSRFPSFQNPPFQISLVSESPGIFIQTQSLCRELSNRSTMLNITLNAPDRCVKPRSLQACAEADTWLRVRRERLWRVALACKPSSPSLVSPRRPEEQAR